jgi:hypothetical protein
MIGSERSMANPPWTSSKPGILKPPTKPKPQPKPAAKAVPHELPEAAWPNLTRMSQKSLVSEIKPSVLPRRVIPQIPQLEDAPAPEDDLEPEPVTVEHYAEIDEPSVEPTFVSQRPELVNAPPRPDSPKPTDETEKEIAVTNITTRKRRRNFSDDYPQLEREGDNKIKKNYNEPRVMVDMKEFLHP